MTITRTSTIVPLLLGLLAQCSLRTERAPGSSSTGATAGASQAGEGSGASSGAPSRAFGGAGAGGQTSAGGKLGSGGVASTMFGSGGVAGTLGRAGAGAGGTGGGFTIASSAVPANGSFPVANTCMGADTSPDLRWAPGVSQAQSYAVELADAATSAPQWIVWDIPATVTSLPAGLATTAMLAMPAGAKQVSTSGNGYVGPCPQGMQRFYEFSIYALPVPTLAGVTTDSPLGAVATAINLSPPIDVAFFGASAGIASAGASGNGGMSGAGGVRGSGGVNGSAGLDGNGGVSDTGGLGGSGGASAQGGF